MSAVVYGKILKVICVPEVHFGQLVKVLFLSFTTLAWS